MPLVHSPWGLRLDVTKLGDKVPVPPCGSCLRVPVPPAPVPSPGHPGSVGPEQPGLSRLSLRDPRLQAGWVSSWGPRLWAGWVSPWDPQVQAGWCLRGTHRSKLFGCPHGTYSSRLAVVPLGLTAPGWLGVPMGPTGPGWLVSQGNPQLQAGWVSP